MNKIDNDIRILKFASTIRSTFDVTMDDLYNGTDIDTCSVLIENASFNIIGDDISFTIVDVLESICYE